MEAYCCYKRISEFTWVLADTAPTFVSEKDCERWCHETGIREKRQYRPRLYFVGSGFEHRNALPAPTPATGGDK